MLIWNSQFLEFTLESNLSDFYWVQPADTLTGQWPEDTYTGYYVWQCHLSYHAEIIVNVQFSEKYWETSGHRFFHSAILKIQEKRTKTTVAM